MKTTEEIEQFVSTAINAKPPIDRMCKAYRTAVETTEKQQARLLKHLRVRDGQVYFKETVKSVEPDIQAAEDAELAIKGQIDEYLTCIGTFGSATALTERYSRLKRQVDIVRHDADAILKQLITKGIERPQEDAKYLAACDMRDRIVSETAEEIKDLSHRIARVKDLLGRF